MSDTCKSPEKPITEILHLISSSRKLDRDHGARKLQVFLSNLNSGKVEAGAEQKQVIYEYVQTHLNAVVETPEESDRPNEPAGLQHHFSQEGPGWEIKHGCLLACYPLLDCISQSAKRSQEDAQFLHNIQTISLKLLQGDQSHSVQLAAGNVLGHLGKVIGEEVYESSREAIFELITKNLRTSHDNLMSPDDQLQSAEQGFDIHVPASLIRDKVVKESVGWHSLEPSMKCLLLFIENLSTNFSKFVDEQLIYLTWATLSHHNRYVREIGFQIVHSLLCSAPSEMEEDGEKLATHLSSGLSDNWNQVRLAASISTRKFLFVYHSIKEKFYPILLPKLCLNRYYKAEGVRVYSQESWRLIFGTEGRIFVEKYFGNVVEYYIAASSSGNPAEREAACSSISELMQKIDESVVSPRVELLLNTLRTCAKDENWSVRDAANLAFGNSTKYYPEIAKPFLEDFYPILFKTLEDPIPILRQGSASSLAMIVSSYGSEAQTIVFDKIVSGLKSIENIKQDEVGSSSNRADCLASSKPDEIRSKVESGHIPSCDLAVAGSIQIVSVETSKAAKEANTQCQTCPGCLRSKATQPWHLVDGCLYLIGTLAEITPCKSELSPLIPLICQATAVKSFTEHYILLETVCKIIPLLATGIGKKPFKEFLNSLFDPIFSAIDCTNPLTSAIGKQAIRFLAEFIGPNILKSRVEMYDSRYVSVFETCLASPGPGSSTLGRGINS